MVDMLEMWSKEKAAEILILMAQSGYWPSDEYAQELIDVLEMNVTLDKFKEILKVRQKQALELKMRKWF